MMWKDLNREHTLQGKNKYKRNEETGLKSKVKKKKIINEGKVGNKRRKIR